MNEQLQSAVSALINESLALFEQGKTFLAAEIPDVVAQLLLWKMLQSLLPQAFLVLLLLVALSALVWALRSNYKSAEVVGPVSMMCCAVFLACILFAADLTWIQILVAPKVYLIEYATSLVK
jgi:hypothetical protein